MCYHQSARQVAQAGRSSGRSTKKYKVFTSQKGLRSTGGPDLLKWDIPGGGIKSAKVAPTLTGMSSIPRSYYYYLLTAVQWSEYVHRGTSKLTPWTSVPSLR